jgi:hypothetical protein
VTDPKLPTEGQSRWHRMSIAAEAAGRYKTDFIARAASMTDDELARELEGLGYEDLVDQLHSPGQTT